MRVLAFNGSPREKGNTHLMIQQVFKVLQTHGIETEEINVGKELVYACKGCWACSTLKRCVIQDDKLNDWVAAMREADGIILASPTYYANVTSNMKALIDRAGNVAGSDGSLARKVGAPIAVNRRGGAIQVYNTLLAFFGIRNMIVPMSTYWNDGVGREIGEVENDQEGLRTMTNLGETMAWLLKKLAA